MKIFKYLTTEEDHKLQQEELQFDSLVKKGFSISSLAHKFEEFDDEKKALKYLDNYKSTIEERIKELESESSGVDTREIASTQTLINEFKWYLFWINRFINGIVNHLMVNNACEPLDLKIISAELDSDIEAINRKIKLYEKSKTSYIRKDIVEFLAVLYAEKYKGEFPIKLNFLKLVYPHLEFSFEWERDSFIHFTKNI